MNRLGEARNTPWKAWNELSRVLAYPWVRLIFAIKGVRWGRAWKIYGTPIIMRHAKSQMLLGSHLELRSSRYSNPLSPNHPVVLATWREGARLVVGDGFAMSGGSICAAQSIIIGNNVAIGANSAVIDTDFHPLRPADRQEQPNDGRIAPVVIEADVFIGANCLILKGVRIGQGAVIGAGSVVVSDVPPHCVAAGNPAIVVRSLAPTGSV